MDDWKLRKDVMDELDFEPSVDSAAIGVSAKAGVVTLSGHVPNYAQKIAAERAARRVAAQDVLARVGIPDPEEAGDRCREDAAHRGTLADGHVHLHARVREDRGEWVRLIGAVDQEGERRELVVAHHTRPWSGLVGLHIGQLTTRHRIGKTEREASIRARARSSHGHSRSACSSNCHWRELQREGSEGTKQRRNE